jgi:putative phosphoesterase
MKIGVISDTHCLPIPKKLLEELATVDLIIHAGDICDEETLKSLNKIQKTRAVQGNMCDSSLKRKLPLKDYFECEGIKIGVTHGHMGIKDPMTNAREQFKDAFVNIVIFGHSHHAFNQTIDGILFFNPGSPNDVIKARFFSYGMIEIQDGKIKAQIIKL